MPIPFVTLWLLMSACDYGHVVALSSEGRFAVTLGRAFSVCGGPARPGETWAGTLEDELP